MTTHLIQNRDIFTAKSIIRSESIIPHFGKVAVLLGGRSAEREVSLESGEAILGALLRKGVDAHAIDPDERLSLTLLDGKFDRVFIALHGKEGEDGAVQGLLQMIGLPFTGSGVSASALAMDKARAKLVMHSVGIQTPIFGLSRTIEEAKAVAHKIGFPLAIKPLAEGSSIGVTPVYEPKALPAAFKKAATYGEVIVEKWITGRDLFVAIVGESVFPSVEVRTPSEFYDYHAKYKSESTEYFCPASELTFEQEKELRALAHRAFCALGCEGWGRIDIVQDKEGQFWVLEVNTIPGMTSHSLVPMSAKVAGIGFDELVIKILETSVRTVTNMKLSEIA